MGLWSLTALVAFVVVLRDCFTFSSRPSHYFQFAPNQTSEEGGSVVLPCSLAFPDGLWIPYTITWRKLNLKNPVYMRFTYYPEHINDQYLGRVRNIADASIQISRLRPSDEGWYECQVAYMNRVPTDEGARVGEEPNSTRVFLNVASPPAFEDSTPSHVLLSPDEPLYLFCKAKFSQGAAPRLTWFKDGRLLDFAPGAPASVKRPFRVDLGPHHLKILRPLPSDEGVYRCRLSTDEGVEEREFSVRLTGGAVIVEAPRNQTLSKGDHLRLSCRAEAVPNNVTYRWFKDGLSFGDQARSVNVEPGVLFVSSVVASDSGFYRCLASNGVGAPAEASAFVDVTYRPIVRHPKKHALLPLGYAASLICELEANPPVLETDWYHNGRQLRFADLTIKTLGLRRTRIVPTATNRITFRKVTRSDAGDYRCNPRNALGYGERSGVIRVDVRDPPRFTVVPKPYYQAMVGRSVQMGCTAAGDPQPVIRWAKMTGNRLMPHSRIALSPMGNLTIHGLQISDAARYKCTCASPVLTLSKWTVVYVETLPYRPAANLSCEMGYFAARLNWAPAFHISLPLHYVVVVKRLSSVESRIFTVRVRPNNATTFKINNLLPDTSYEIQIKSQAPDGLGNLSKPLHVRTLTLSVTPKTVTPLNDPNATLLSYSSVNDQGFRPDESSVANAQPIASTFGATYPLDEAEPRPHDMWIPKGLAPAPPTDLCVTMRDFAEEFALVNVSWSAPSSTPVPVLYFLVQFKDLSRVGRSSWESVGDRVAALGHSNVVDIAGVTVGPLTPGRKYAFRVFSFSRQAFSESSSIAIFDIPEPLVETPPLSLSLPVLAGVSGGILFLVVTAACAFLARQLCASDSGSDERSTAMRRSSKEKGNEKEESVLLSDIGTKHPSSSADY